MKRIDGRDCRWIAVLLIVMTMLGGVAPAQTSCKPAIQTDEHVPLNAFSQLPQAMQSAIRKHFHLWEDSRHLKRIPMASYGAAWLGNQKQGASTQLPFRRFVTGGHRLHRWFLIYQYDDQERTAFHLVVSDITDEPQSANLRVHFVGSMNDVCDMANLFMNNLGSPGQGMDDNLYW